ncbi:hypothetical protein K461DRAFT_286739 [Myriangium duriaei CBS 260.36]|uniref:Uncharacterized protein n=1 Tax=Myriangium duriaei CBS 260.36 TaxID=1168546 RepID=A0A9P4MG73_9PEZI|nr:hypothetical protein K461DRAFT_286739 [Myriangium duriaei CBS 260.36]
MAARSLDAASLANPSSLPPRYQIRRLTPEHSLWVCALTMHSNTFHQSVFSKVYPIDQVGRFKQGIRAAAYLVDHQIKSGLSFGVFDLEYKFQHRSSEASGGAFLWDPNEEPMTGAQILSAMDFPLVSIALSYDGIDPLNSAGVAPLVACLPVFGTIHRALEELDPRKGSWHAKERGQVLMRNATATRVDYKGRGLMAGLARFLMREAQLNGFKGVNIVAMNDAVTHVWTNPKQQGMKGEVTAEFWSPDYEEEDAGGKKVNPFFPAEQQISRIWLCLDA